MEEVWRYIVEWIRMPYEAYMHGVRRILYSGSTRYQRVDIVETHSFGKCLFLDGKLQSSEFDEFVYHEALVHPAMLTHPQPRHVLVVGGGEGATIREVLRHPTVEEVTMVDLDGELVELCRRYMPEWSRGAFEDPRVRLVVGEGRRFLEESGETYDVIVLDLVDPTPGSPAALLYTREFYSIVKDRLSGDGVMVTQATSTRFSTRTFAAIRNTVAQLFPVARAYFAPVVSFQSLWGFVLGSKGRDPLGIDRGELERRIAGLGGDLRFYDVETHYFILHMPRFLREKVEEIRDVYTDEKPVYMSY